MPSRTLAALAPAPRTYAELRRGVEATLLHGQRLIERAKVRTYWETGRLIQQHLLLNADRAAYGAQVVPRLARDLEVSARVLYQCLQFARAYPILHDRAEFTWAHYRVLIQIPDEAQRKAVTAEALKRGWTSPQLETRVRELALLAAPADEAASETAPTPPAARLLVPKRGTPGVYRLVARGDRLAVDLGFKIYRPLTAAEARGLEEGGFVRLDEAGAISPADDATKADLFTYRATVPRVIDGDTLVVEIELFPQCIVEQKLRLRGLDCPEIDTPGGKAAKRFTLAAVAAAAAVSINTSKPDKYDRYLADVFLGAEGGDDVFLNNALLENGHAVRKDAWEFRDWEKEILK